MIKKLPLLLVPFLLVSCGGTYNAEKAYWQVSRQHRQVLSNPAAAPAGDFDATVADLKNVIASYPSWKRSAELQLSLAQMYLLRGDPKTAEAELKKLLMNFPDRQEACARAQSGLGMLYEQQGDIKQAVAAFDAVTEKYPLSAAGLQAPLLVAAVYQRKGLADETQQAYDKAVRNYQNLIDMNPYSKAVPVLQEFIAMACVKQGRPQKAVEALTSFAEKYPKSGGAPSALVTAARIYQETQKDNARAIPLYRKVVDGYPKTAVAKETRFKLGGIYMQARDYARAGDEYNCLVKEFPGDKAVQAAAHKALGISYDRAGRWDRAQQEFDLVLSSYPYTREALQVPFLIAGHLEREHRAADMEKIMDEAIIRCKNVIIKNPGKPIAVEAQEMIAASYLARKKQQEAIGALNELRTAYPADPRAAAALFKIALIYENDVKDPVKAAEAYRQFTATYSGHELAALAKARLEKLQAGTKGWQKI